MLGVCKCSLKHQNRRPEYVKDWFNVVNWTQVSDFYKAATAGKR